MKAQKFKLSNGIRVVETFVPGVESVTVQVFVKGGSRDEDLRVSGLAHFLEHMVFKGSKNYPTAHAISSTADSLGAEINASTDKERTSFYLKVAKQHIGLSFKLLSDMVFEPILDPDEIEREKGVIVAEISMYEDLPPHKAFSAFDELMFSGSDLEHDVAGKKETVRATTREDFVDFREKFYTPARMVISVAGSFEQSEVRGLAEEYFGDKVSNTRRVLPGAFSQKNPQGDPFLGVPLPPSPVGSVVNKVKLITKKTEQAHLIIGFRGNPLGHRDRYVESVLASILGGGMSSRLFTEVREKRGLAYYIKSVLQHHTDTGYFAARAGVAPDKVYEALEVIIQEFKKISNLKFLISKGEIEKAKEYAKGRFILGLEDTETVSDLFGEDELLEGKTRTVREIVGGIDKVTREDILRVSKGMFTGRELKLAVVGPYTKAEKFEKLLQF